MNTTDLIKHIISTLDDNKALNIVDIDVQRLTDITDHMIICTGTSSRHLASLADKVINSLRDLGVKPYGTDGEKTAEWVLIDYTHVVVHIMLEETRLFYSLEKLWTVTEETRSKTGNAD